MDALGLPLLIIAGALAFSVILATLEHRSLGVSSSQLKAALSLAGRAVLTFWLAFMLIAPVGATISIVARGDAGDWGYFGAMVITVVAAVFFGGIAALCHGAAVLSLLGIYSAMHPPHRKASSIIAAIGVLLAVFLVLPALGIPGKAVEAPFILNWVTLPVGLSIPTIAAVSLLPGARAGGGAPTSQVTRFRDALLLVASVTILVTGMWIFVRRQAALCDDSLVSRLRSPDGVHEVVVYSEDCGAPTDISTHVTILSAGARVPSRWGSTGPSVTPPDTGSPILVIASNHGTAAARFPGEGPNVDATWVAPDSLLLRFDPQARILRQESTAGRVVVHYGSRERGGP
jgi:hypothetical protein